jgi:hypothetical protein
MRWRRKSIPLVIPFGMEMFDIFPQRSPQRALDDAHSCALIMLMFRICE